LTEAAQTIQLPKKPKEPASHRPESVVLTLTAWRDRNRPSAITKGQPKNSPAPPPVDAVKDEKLTPLQAAARVADLAIRARKGDAEAYVRLNDATRDSPKSSPVHMVIAQLHVDLIRAMTADLICKVCGEYHYQDADVPGNKGIGLKPVTCPHCGAENCAGGRNTFVETCPGTGKTEIAEKIVAFRAGLATYRKRPFLCLIAGASQPEADDRLADISLAMSRPEHKFIFGEDACPLPKHPSSRLVLRANKKRPVIRSYGIQSLPSGKHVDLMLLDDICNQTTSFLKPALGIAAWAKMTGTVLRSGKIGTVTLYLTNTWRHGDTTSKMRDLANRETEEWTTYRMFCGGPDENFKSPCESRLPTHKLRYMHSVDPFEYERGFMGREISGDVQEFKKPHYWVLASDLRRMKYIPADFLAGVEVESEPPEDQTGWTHIMVLDPAFTGEGPSKLTHNRSEAAYGIMSYNPRNGKIYVVYAESKRHVAGTLLDNVVRPLVARYHAKFVVCESGASQKELEAEIRKAGFNMLFYNPSQFGDKRGRKDGVVAAWNSGKVLVRGYCSGGVSPQLQAYRGQDALVDATTLFPAVCKDLIDFLEIGYRKLWELFGAEAARLVEGLKDQKERTRDEKIYDMLMERMKPQPVAVRGINRIFNEDIEPGTGVGSLAELSVS
jgi:hypothetical protein